jgi:hypothetical protein
MASENYKKVLCDIENYFGVSYQCAQYIYHRALRSKRQDSNFLEWDVKLQNAIVKADKCLGIVWEKIIFGKEESELKQHGILLEDMPNTVFKWNEEEESEWKVVTHKKIKRNKQSFSKLGIML